MQESTRPGLWRRLFRTWLQVEAAGLAVFAILFLLGVVLTFVFD